MHERQVDEGAQRRIDARIDAARDRAPRQRQGIRIGGEGAGVVRKMLPGLSSTRIKRVPSSLSPGSTSASRAPPTARGSARALGLERGVLVEQRAGPAARRRQDVAGKIRRSWRHPRIPDNARSVAVDRNLAV